MRETRSVRTLAVVLVFLASGAALAARADDDSVPLTSWTAPPYWAPTSSRSLESKRPEAPAVASPPLPFHAVTPCRIADTRGNGFTGAYGPPNLTAGAVRSCVVTSPSTSCGIPSTAAAVSFNFAVTTLTANGNLIVYPTGGSAPTVSSLNWTPSEVAISNAAVIPLGTGGAINVLVNGPVGSMTDLVIDVNGYYAPDALVYTLNGLSADVTLGHDADMTVGVSGQTITIGTNAASASTANTLVRRDASGNFAAGTITGTLSGNASGFTGSLLGDVTGTQSATVVSSVGGSTAANVHNAEILANAATSANTANTIVRRNASGNFAAGTITGTLSGNASGFTGSLSGDVTGTQSATVVSSVGGSTAANVHSAEVLANAATSANTAFAIVRRASDGSVDLGRVFAALGYTQPGTGGETLRTVRGLFSGADGSILAGSGFSVTRTSVGNYSVSFSTAFPSFPSVTANAISLGPMQVVFNSYGAGSINISTFNSGGAAADAPFVTFIAIGPS